MIRILSSVLAVLAVTAAAAQTGGGSRPRLVLGIVVDQLRTDYIEYLKSHFCEKGFKALLTEGFYMPDVDFAAGRLDAVNSTAMLLTGAYPARTGVPASSVWDDTSGTPGVLRLPLTQGNTSQMTNDSFTPAPLRISTVADELAVATGGESKIWSVAMDPQQAVLLAGHAASGAVWVNNTSGNWATTLYYGGMPSAVSARNIRHPLSHRLDTMQWKPCRNAAEVPWLEPGKKTSQFRYTFSTRDRDVYRKFSLTPLANAEVTDVAIELMRDMHLGATPGRTDMLNVAYTVAPYRYAASGGMTAEAETVDAYLRLDAQIARLVSEAEALAGKGNALIWLASTGYCDYGVVPDERFRIPGGEFSTRKAKSLINSYLSAKFGSAGYVSAIRDGRIWLDRQAIESMRLDAGAVISDARDFLIKMGGVADARTASEILSGSTSGLESLRRSFDPQTGGDILVDFMPGWSVLYDDQLPVVTQYSNQVPALTPAFMMGPGIESGKATAPVKAVSLAPALSAALRIRAPNGAQDRE